MFSGNETSCLQQVDFGLLVKTGAEKVSKHKNTTLLVKTGAKSAAI